LQNSRQLYPKGQADQDNQRLDKRSSIVLGKDLVGMLSHKGQGLSSGRNGSARCHSLPRL